MRRNQYFRSIDDVLSSALAERNHRKPQPATDRILQSTRLEDKIYAGLRGDDPLMDKTEAAGSQKLSTFPALARDVYQSFYSLSVRYHDEERLSETAKRFNRPILDGVMTGADYTTVKSVCEGRQLPAYDAAFEFIQHILGDLDSLLEKAGGDKNAFQTLEKLKRQETELGEALDKLLKKRGQGQIQDAELDRQIVDAANKAAGKARQVKAVGGMIQDNLQKNRDTVDGVIVRAVQAAKQKAEETAEALVAWGCGNGEASPKRLQLDREILGRIRQNPVLTEISRLLGRFKEIAAKTRKSAYTYGRGEMYALERGSDLRNTVTSEFSLLALPDAIPLFLRKYRDKELLQYQRREAIFKGRGDIVMCLDESGSAKGGAPWGKAVALTLLDAAMKGKRKFALIHFAGKGKYKTDLFIPGKFGPAEMMTAAETFLDGGTDFETPLHEAHRLIEREGFENADIVFATDGVCTLAKSFIENLARWKESRPFSITGLLLDTHSPGMEFSLTPFCDTVYRTSLLAQEKIVESLIASRV